MVRPVNDWRQIAHFIEHLTRDQGTLCSNPGFVCHYFHVTPLKKFTYILT